MTIERTTPADELAPAMEAGWPRAFVRWDERTFPLPWVNGLAPALRSNGFLELNAWRFRQCEDHRRCFCCGELLRRLSIMGRHRASLDDTEPQVWLTDGPAGHPRCVALAAAHCPHLLGQHRGREDYVIALAWEDIEVLGYVEMPAEMLVGNQPRLVVRPDAVPLTLGRLRELAVADPLGYAPIREQA